MDITALSMHATGAERRRGGPAPGARTVRRRVALERAESLRLLDSVPFGRVSAVDRGAPMVRPVNHLVVDGCVIVRTRRDSVLAALAADAGAGGVAAAYEADLIDAATHTGWSVIVTGRMCMVQDPLEVGRYRMLLYPWVDQVSDRVLCMRCDVVTGVRLTLRAGRLSGIRGDKSVGW